VIGDALGVVDNLYTQGAALPTGSGANAGAAAITTSAIGGYPFWAPDNEAGSLAVKSTVGGVDYWYWVNPSDLGDLVQTNVTSLATLTDSVTAQGTNVTALSGRVTTLEAPGGTLASKVTTMSGPRRMWIRTLAEGLPTGIGEQDGDVCIRANT